MPSIRRTLKASLWGVPGPAIVGCMIALAFAFFENDSWQSALTKATRFWWIPLGEAIVGSIYGLMRRSFTAFDGEWRKMTLRRGATIGAVAWVVVGLPPLCLMLVVAVLSSMFLPGLNWPLVGLAFGIYALHIFGGAIAGFHVEYYLLHGREPDDAVS